MNAIKLGFVTQHFGIEPEVWMWRQFNGLREFQPSLLTWDYYKPDQFPVAGSVKVLDFDPTPADADGISRWIYRLRCTPGRNYYATVGAEKREINRWIDETSPSVILAQFGFSALRILPVTCRRSIPVIAHFHGLDLSSSLRNRWYRWSLLDNIDHFKAIVVVGSHQKRWMLDQGVPEDKVHLIPCGVPTGEFHGNPKSTQNKTIRFVAISRLVPKKGLEYTIKAFKTVKENLPDSELIIIGDGPLRDSLESLCRQMSLEQCVEFKGSIDPGQVKKELASATVFLQHSVVSSNGDVEGFGVSASEAASMEMPIVCSDSPGLVDQVVDGVTGFVTPMYDVTAMANKMVLLAQDAELRKRMGMAGRRRMVESYDQGNQIKKLAKVIKAAVT
jgi:glycosyltransferase involved in cell wall biosynthesis